MVPEWRGMVFIKTGGVLARQAGYFLKWGRVQAGYWRGISINGDTTCHYLEFVIISDSKMISSQLLLSLSVLELIFKHIFPPNFSNFIALQRIQKSEYRFDLANFNFKQFCIHPNWAILIAVFGLHFQIHQKIGTGYFKFPGQP